MRGNYAPLDIAAFTAELAGMFQSAATQAGIVLEVDCPRTEERAWVDREMWEKIVLNLITNALKFTLAGSVTIRLRAQGEAFALEVTDTGIGIPPADLPRVFDRFHRVAGATVRSQEGTGIGLALVRELVALHGGEVTVESELGKGSTFRVIVPKGFAHLPAELVSDSAIDPGVLGRFGSAHSREVDFSSRSPVPAPAPVGDGRPRVLVVDDNSDLRGYMASLLGNRYDVTVAVDGRAALEAVARQRPDLIVSDVMMPNLDGFGLVGALRAEPETVSLPVILLSARAGEDPSIEGLDAGADDYVSKPFSARELLARVRTHLLLAKMRSEWASELERTNRELDAFSSAVSHDLRAPLRAIGGFSAILLEDHAARLDDDARGCLDEIQRAVQGMSALIEGLLALSRVSRAALEVEPVDLGQLARFVVNGLRRSDPQRRVDVHIADDLATIGDARLLEVVLTNLIGNAWKFTSRTADARIEIGRRDGPEPAFFVRDNGAGYDDAYAAKLFGPFQRLHSASEFEGTGVGLSTVQRVIHRHRGRVWAEGAVGKGATFYFSLPSG